MTSIRRVGLDELSFSIICKNNTVVEVAIHYNKRTSPDRGEKHGIEQPWEGGCMIASNRFQAQK